MALLREYDFEKEPVVSIVKKILLDSIKFKASDIHFDPTETELSIRFRINGNLQEYTVAPENIKSNITTRIKILAGMNITDSMRPQTGTLKFETEGKPHNMQVTSLPITDGEKIVVHINNYDNNIKSISKIGISPEDTDKIKRLVKNQEGIILITGTTSSGKTTTMYAMLKEVNNKSINIISIEDPVKVKLEGINQVEISPEKGLNYKTALKYSLLQDPNIICIDNLIDDEITRDVIRAAITGRLVISSLYTKNAYTTIDTLLNMDIENYLLGSNINGIISQRLVKKLCPHCKTLAPTTDYEKTIIKQMLNKDVEELYHAKGCEECQNGYLNQIPVIEVIEINDEIRSAITNKKNRKTIRDLLYKNNNTILKDGFNKVLEGETTFNEIIRITDIKADLTEDDKELKEYILGNLHLQNTQETKEVTTEQKKEPTPVVETKQEEVKQVVEEQTKIEPKKEEPTPVIETKVEEPTPTVTKSTEEKAETIEEITNVVPQTIEEPTETIQEATPIVEEETRVEEPTTTVEEKVETIEEVTETIEETPTPIKEPTIETIDQLIESIDITEVAPPPVVEELEPVVKESTPVEETPAVETQPTKEATPVAEETTTKETVQEETKEEPKPEPPKVIEEDDEDEDDFGYGDEYENSF